MKRFFALIALFSVTLFAELAWIEDYSAGLAQAKKEGKYVMVMLTRENCPACEYMKDIVFEDDDIVAAVEKNYVPVMLDIDTHILHGLSYIGTPTFYFLEEGGRRIERYDGGANQKDFMDLLLRVEKKIAPKKS